MRREPDCGIACNPARRCISRNVMRPDAGNSWRSGIVVLVPPRSPAAVSGPAIDLSEDVADAFHWQLGPDGGVVLKQRSGEDLPETAAWVIGCLNHLCEFSTPERALKVQWL